MKRNNLIGFVPFYLLVVILFIGAVQGGSKAVTTISDSMPLKRQNRIVIDAGHGGIDGGATSCTGILESAINLEIALRLNDFMHLLGYETIMVRTTDTSVYTQGETIAAQKVSDLKERVRIVNDTDNAILVSIHQNTFSDRRYGGAQVFYANNTQSKRLADQLQTNLVSQLNPGSNRKSKRTDGIYLLDHTSNVPGVLIECGFLSNPEEEAKLRDPEYQRRLCCVIAGSVNQFINA